VASEPGSNPTIRDYGCGLVATLAALIFVASVIGGMFALLGAGVSFELIVGVCFNVLFWFWIAVGASRRTIWSTHARPVGSEEG
jgi:hypothetical protein